MSQTLPAQPHLDHLTKQAKVLLRDLLLRNPKAKLADALHEVARTYGFASWPKLKAHVVAVRVAQATVKASPFEGRWIADLSRSTRHPANLFQRAVIDFIVVGDEVNITSAFVDATGGRLRDDSTVQVDGATHATSNGYELVATWRGSHTFETIATQHGEIVGRGRYEISPDGATLTISAPEQVIVFARG